MMLPGDLRKSAFGEGFPSRGGHSLPVGLGVLLVGLTLTPTSWAQSASLLVRPPTMGPTIKVEQVSLTKLPEPTPFRRHDLIQIKVDERTLQQANARANRQRNTQYQYTFSDLVVLLAGLRLRADQAVRQQRPAMNVKSTNTLQTTSQANRVDRLTFTIMSEVAEVRPNGTLVIEAHQSVEIDNEVKQFLISGVIDPRDVNPLTRSIDSDKVASKQVKLLQSGPTRDAVRRGWMVRVLDMVLPF